MKNKAIIAAIIMACATGFCDTGATEFWYHGGSGTVRNVMAGWPPELRSAQRSILQAAGFQKVVNYARPKSQMPFAILTPVYTANDDDTYSVTWTEQPLYVKLSQRKLMEHPVVQPQLPLLTQTLSGSPQLTEWWIHDMRYLRGSDLARVAMAAFGMTQAQIEKIVLECRE